MTYPISLSIDGGSPAIAFTLTVAGDLTMTVDVLTGASLPQPAPQRLGTFAGHLDPATAAALADWARGTATLADDGAMVPGTVLGQVGLGGGPVRSVAPDSLDPRLAEALTAAALAALADPRSAAEFAADDAALHIRGLGQRPIRLVLCDPDVPGYWARIWRDNPSRPEGRDQLGPDQLGTVPQGVFELAPGAVISVPLPSGPGEGGGFLCWRAGAGPQRSILAGIWSARRPAA